MPDGVRYVLTLDADTRLPREAPRRLIGKMAHPLNRPRFDAKVGRVVEGYAILQPRVAFSLPTSSEATPFQRAFSGAAGVDPYAAAVSDVYQDLFGEGSFAGKGIYDVDAFEAALAGRVPESTLLSHDLFEGIFARAGLASDVEVVEEFPSRYDVASLRQHRWVRGDWQLLPWILGRRDVGAAEHGRGHSRLPLIGLWKMLDNLRRSLSAPSRGGGAGGGLDAARAHRHSVVRIHPAVAGPAHAAAAVRGDPAAPLDGHSAQPSARVAPRLRRRARADRRCSPPCWPTRPGSCATPSAARCGACS